jgi:molecular chaperone DnaK
VNVAFDHPSGGIRFKFTRQEFERLTADLLERTRLTVRNVLAETGTTWKDVTRLLVVGGSTRMPMVHRLLEEESGKTVDCSLSADEAVAHGAAIYAGLLMKRGTVSAANIRIRNVNSHNLGVLGREPATGRPRTKVMIPRNTPLPARATSRFTTYRDNQRSVAITVVEGGDASGQNATHIGRCVIHDLPRGLPAGTPVDVAFEYAENGRVAIKARLPSVQREAAIVLERSSGLSEKLLREWKNTLRSESSPLRLA